MSGSPARPRKLNIRGLLQPHRKALAVGFRGYRRIGRRVLVVASELERWVQAQQ